MWRSAWEFLGLVFGQQQNWLSGSGFGGFIDPRGPKR